MRITDDLWLSERIGYPAFTLGDLAESGPDLEALTRHRRERDRAMYQTRLDTGRGEIAETLVRAGFSLVGASVTLSRSPQPENEPDPGLRWAQPADEPELTRIAERSFRNSRFHSDPHVSDAVADAIKREWIRACLRGSRGDGVLVAVEGDRVLGFLAVLIATSDDGTAWVIDLIGVDPESQRRGVGTRLTRAFISEAVGNADRVQVGTQPVNAPAISFYERLGFKLLSSSYDFHMHHGLQGSVDVVESDGG